MLGTDGQPKASPSIIHQLTVAGWLLLGGEFGFIFFQLERVRRVDGTRFATAWDQRIEVMSFIMLPPNIPVLVTAAAVAIITTFLAGRERGQWLAWLLRSVAAIAITFVFIGAAAIVEIATREGQGSELDSIFFRLGGMSLAAGIAYLCRVADTSAGERETRRGQPLR